MQGLKKSAIVEDPVVPLQWQEVGQVDQLYVYPVKSFSPVAVPSISTGENAARAKDMVDRQFIVLDRKGKQATGRRWPHMTLVKPEVLGRTLTLAYPGMDSIDVALPQTEGGDVDSEGKLVKVDVFGDLCKGLDLGDKVGEWVSEVILGDAQGGMRLVYHSSGESSRPDKRPNLVVSPMLKTKDKPYFADAFPYLMLSRPSLSELNALLEKEGVDLEVEEKRFRPNIFIDGPFPAFEEDKWPWVKIGEVVFRHSQLCDRCDFTQVDPALGDKHAGGEPLKTLRKYRCTQDPEEKKVFGSSPFFGVNISVEEAGEVKVGDKVFIGKSS